MIELINTIAQSLSITAVPVLIVLVRYHYAREREKNIATNEQNEVLAQLVEMSTSQASTPDSRHKDVLFSIEKHVAMIDSKVDDCKIGITNLHNRFDNLK